MLLPTHRSKARAPLPYACKQQLSYRYNVAVASIPGKTLQLVQSSVFQLFHKLSDGLTMCCVGHSASMGACHHERKARDWQHARLVYQYGGQALEDTRFLLAYPSKRLKTEERTALTRAIPEDNVVGTEQNIAKPVAKASLSKGIFRKANPSNGVRPRIDISPNIKPAGALNASIASCVFSVKPEITKMVHR